MTPSISQCRICQCERRDGEQWFLLVGNQWEDRLRILPWSERLSSGEGMHAACSPGHVQQLVAHWMATGALDYPFAHVGAVKAPSAPLPEKAFNQDFSPHAGSRVLGELAVHRESLRRLLMESPESLVPVLDALVSALYKNGNGDPVADSTLVKQPERIEVSVAELQSA